MNMIRKIMLVLFMACCATSATFGMPGNVGGSFPKFVLPEFVIPAFNYELLESIDMQVLYFCSMSGDANMLKLTLNNRSESRRSAIVMSVIKESFGKTAEGGTLLHVAASNNHTEIVKILLSVVPEAQQATFVMMKNQSGRTALHYAAINGNAEMAKILLLAVFGAQNTDFVMTLLQIAKECGYESFVQVLQS